MTKKEIYIPLIGIIVGELLIFFNFMTLGLVVYTLDLLMIIFMILISALGKNIKIYLQGLILIIILKMVNFSIPFSNNLLIYGIMILPIYSAVKNQKISYKELGIDFKKIVYFPIFILIIWLIITVLGYYMKFKLNINVILISAEMILIVGTIEEFIFRSVLQNRIEKILNSKLSIIMSGLIFGIMHSSYGIISEIVFSSLFGLCLGYIFYKTKDLILTSSLHGSANVFLYGTFPLLSIGSLSLDTILLNGIIISFFLIILATISFVMYNTKYWNKLVSGSFEMSIYPLLLTFLSIILFKIMNILKIS